ncbi:MAG: DUF4418 family protein [Lachnospiraceae bacterium]|nr:DUF4418 family protein [Lachnospiraceae bacterium]
MEKQKHKIGISDILLLVVSIIFFVGILTFFKPCGPMDDGNWMTCHWAGNAIAGASVVLLIIAILHILIPDARIKIGLSIAVIPIAALAAVIPGHLINLCMMETMRCHAVMTPATIVMAAFMIAAAAFDILVNRKKDR